MPEPPSYNFQTNRHEANIMLNKSIALAIALSVTFGFTQAVTASEDAAAPATVVIYRADEALNTKRLNLDVSADKHNLGKLTANDVVVAQGEAGTYTLGTSMKGTEELTLELKPGVTYYVHATLEMRGTRVYVALQQVEEQVARVQQPALEGVI